MKPCKLYLGIAAVVVIWLFTAPAAHADTYQVFFLTGTPQPGLTDIIGITASGAVVLDNHSPSGAEPCKSSGLCQTYETWVNGRLVNSSYTAPDFVYDNGSPCTVDTSFLTYSVPGTCNNGHEVYNAGPNAPIPYTLETFIGPDPVADLFGNGALFLSDFDLNASGDFVFDQFHPAGDEDQYSEAIDLTTDQVPEPASVFLLGTGLLATLGTMRRRLV